MHFQSIYFALSLHIKKVLLIANRHLLAGARLEDILYDTSMCMVELQTATVDLTIAIKPDTPFNYLLCLYTFSCKNLTKQIILYCYYICWGEEVGCLFID